MPDCEYCQGSGWVDCDAPWCTEEGHGVPCFCQNKPPVIPFEHHWTMTARTWADYRDRASNALRGTIR